MCRNDIKVTIKIPMDGPDINGRIYPKEVVQKSIDDFYVKKEQAGELGVKLLPVVIRSLNIILGYVDDMSIISENDNTFLKVDFTTIAEGGTGESCNIDNTNNITDIKLLYIGFTSYDYDMSMFFDIPSRSYCLDPNIQDTIDKIDFSTLSNIDKTKEEE